jgi:hypothetical protein
MATRSPRVDALADATECRIPAVVNFAKTLMSDIQAVRNAVIERWSNGQTEGQINRLKTFKRAMFGRANIHRVAQGQIVATRRNRRTPSLRMALSSDSMTAARTTWAVAINLRGATATCWERRR